MESCLKKGYSGWVFWHLEGEVVMKKVSFRLRNFDKEQFLTFNIDNEAELDEELLDFLEDEEPQGIVPVIFEDEDEEFDTFSYNITDKIRLSELSNQEINTEMVLMAMRGLVLALIDMAEYRIPLSYLVLHRNYIYIDSDYKVEFICIPLEDMQGEVDINHFLRSFIASLRFDPSENGDYVARMLTFVNNSEIFNLHKLLMLVEDLMNDLGIEIPENNSSEIYADYQEVESEKDAVDLVEELDDFEEEDEISIHGQTDEWQGDTSILKDEAAGEEDIPDEAEPEDDSEISEEAEEEAEVPSQEKVMVDTPDEPEDSPEEEAEASLDEEVKENEEEEQIEETETEDAQADEASEETDEEAISTEEMDKADTAELREEELQQEEDVADDVEESDQEEDAQNIVDKLKKKGIKKSAFKTKEATVTGVVIQDELDEFLAEKEKEEQEIHHEESGLKIKKNIKVSRASIVKNTQEELKAAEEAAAEAAVAEGVVEEQEAEPVETEEEEAVSNSILSQTIGTTGILKGAPVPKANPYLVRVNTDERIMITKQNFKIGKASMGVDYTVKGNSAVSRIHAIITNKDGIYYVKDNKSTNHTFVNGKAIDDGENELLTHDSKIVLGDEEFIFKLR